MRGTDAVLDILDGQSLIEKAQKALGGHLALASEETAHGLLQDSTGIQPYADGAISIWEEILQKGERKPELLHHQALAYHARAFDREASNADNAFPDWRRAHALWAELLGCEDFWERLGAKMAKCRSSCHPDIGLQFRDALPDMILSVHSRLAIDLAAVNNFQRARKHTQLIEGSPYPASVKESHYSLIFESLCSDVSEHFRKQQYQQASQALARFLSICPGYVAAQCLLVEAFNKEFDCTAEEKKAETIALHPAAAAVNVLARQASSDPQVRSLIAAYYFKRGYVKFRVVEKREESLRNGRLGHDLLNAGIRTAEEAVKEFRRSLELDSRGPLSEQARAGLVRCLTAGGQFALKMAVEKPAGPLGQSLNQALHSFEEALRADENAAPARIYYAQALAVAERFSQAISQLDIVEKKTSEPNALDAAREIRKQLSGVISAFQEYGGEEAFQLRQQAAKVLAMDPDKAADLLRQALQAAGGYNRKLQAELAICLDNAACQKTNEAIAHMKLGFPSMAWMPLRSAKEMLKEALAVDPVNQKARSDLETVKTVMKTAGCPPDPDDLLDNWPRNLGNLWKR